ASSPTAPVPANPSRNRAPSMRGANALKSVSRTLSDDGRRPSHVGASSRRPLSVPAMILIVLSDSDQTESAFPAAGRCSQDWIGGSRFFEPAAGFFSGLFHQRVIADEVADP